MVEVPTGISPTALSEENAKRGIQPARGDEGEDHFFPLELTISGTLFDSDGDPVTVATLSFVDIGATEAGFPRYATAPLLVVLRSPLRGQMGTGRSSMTAHPMRWTSRPVIKRTQPALSLMRLDRERAKSQSRIRPASLLPKLETLLKRKAQISFTFGMVPLGLIIWREFLPLGISGNFTDS